MIAARRGPQSNRRRRIVTHAPATIDTEQPAKPGTIMRSPDGSQNPIVKIDASESAASAPNWTANIQLATNAAQTIPIRRFEPAANGRSYHEWSLLVSHSGHSRSGSPDSS